MEQRIHAEIVVRHHPTAAEHAPRNGHRFARFVDALRDRHHFGMPADAADDFHIETRARHTARNERRGRARIRGINFQRCRNEKEKNRHRVR